MNFRLCNRPRLYLFPPCNELVTCRRPTSTSFWLDELRACHRRDLNTPNKRQRTMGRYPILPDYLLQAQVPRCQIITFSLPYVPLLFLCAWMWLNYGILESCPSVKTCPSLLNLCWKCIVKCLHKMSEKYNETSYYLLIMYVMLIYFLYRL